MNLPFRMKILETLPPLNEITEDSFPQHDNMDTTLTNNQNKRPASCTSPKSTPSASMETDSHTEDMISAKKQTTTISIKKSAPNLIQTKLLKTLNTTKIS
jgi:hypothetical protein